MAFKSEDEYGKWKKEWEKTGTVPPLKSKQSRTNSFYKTTPKGVLFPATIIFIFVLFVYLFVPTHSNNTTPAPDVIPTTQPLKLSIGDTGKLNLCGKKDDWIAIDKSTYNNVRKIVAIQDGYGLLALMKMGRMFFVNNNAKVLIIDDNKGFQVDRIEMLPNHTLNDVLGINSLEYEKAAYAFALLREKSEDANNKGINLYKVRILEGTNKGMAGWVSETEITKTE